MRTLESQINTLAPQNACRRPMRTQMEMRLDEAESLTLPEVKERMDNHPHYWSEPDTNGVCECFVCPAMHSHDFCENGPVLVCACGAESEIIR